MAALTTSLLVGSMALTAASTYSQYKSQRASARGAEEMSEFEAALMDAQSEDAINRGREDESRLRFGARKLAGSQKVSLAAQGIDTGSGSAAAILAETAVMSEIDAQTIRNNAYREAMGFKVQGQLTRRAGANQAQSLRNQSYSTLLTGTSQLVGMYASTRSTVPRSSKPKP